MPSLRMITAGCASELELVTSLHRMFATFGAGWPPRGACGDSQRI